jgi:trans-aconitate methyltransferase
MAVTEIENTPEAWSHRAVIERTAWDAAGWTLDGQIDRFAAAARAVQVQPGERVLDYGCGAGAFVNFLPTGIVYVGFDTAPGMIDRARRAHADHTFQGWEPLGNFDVIVCIGPFNLADRWSKQHTWHTIRRLWEKTDRVLAVSLYAGTDETCLIYTEDEVTKVARGLSYYSTVERHRHNDLLLVARR